MEAGSRRGSIVGRGAASNPKNRFEKIEAESEESDASMPETIYLRDRSRSVIARNTSPDIGFDASLNPYRGCGHGCVYCMAGDTLILIADGTTRRLQDVRVGDEIYGTVRRGSYRRYVKTRVLAHWATRKPAYRITLGDGTSLVAGADHRFLTGRGWKFVTGTEQGVMRRPHLTINDKLLGTGGFAEPPSKTTDYKSGYLCGLVRADGHLGAYTYSRAGRADGMVLHQFRLALADGEALRRAARYILEFGVATRSFVSQEASAGRKRLQAIRTSARRSVERVRDVTSWPVSASDDWRRGFLAGIFDAEGAYGGNTLRISNTEPAIVEQIKGSLGELGFDFVLEQTGRDKARPVTVVRIRGGLREHLRFFHSTDPAIPRKRDLEGIALKSDANLRVTTIEPIGVRRLFDITTGTGDFMANGVVSHNCYARPMHEFLGFSAGLDFETRILVKEDAPALLRKELSSPRWKPQTLALSVATDCYQPVEKKLRLTRRCLEVLAEFRNPVAVVTKNHLVTRDIDLLSELVRYDAASVAISLTTLDDDLRRRMEPRTSSPSRRLSAIRELADAGIPVGVLTAPVIPGLTDHELPDLLSAAAQAGATFAGYTLLRLPHAVAPLFEDWLQRNFPERKDKVLNRVREVRGGKLNDPRFGTRMTGEGVFAEHVARLFEICCRRAGFEKRKNPLSTAAFRRDVGGQPALFD